MPIYTPQQRERRDSTPWTMVQAVLAPLQFVVFIVSVVLVVRFLFTGDGYGLATVSVLAKTFILYLIMLTGALWEKAVFGQYLFAPAFFWEDMVSMAVIALHSAYIVVLLTASLNQQLQMCLALAAYVAYLINAAQFLWKFRLARRASFEQPGWVAGSSTTSAAVSNP